MCELCAAFPGAGTPTQYTGLVNVFSDWICAEIDKGLAQYRRWYLARFEAQQKVGKHRYESKYKTLNDALGVTEEIRRGGFQSGAALIDTGGDFRQAFIEAAKQGKRLDVMEWTRAQQDAEDDE